MSEGLTYQTKQEAINVISDYEKEGINGIIKEVRDGFKVILLKNQNKVSIETENNIRDYNFYLPRDNWDEFARQLEESRKREKDARIKRGITEFFGNEVEGIYKSLDLIKGMERINGIFYMKTHILNDEKLEEYKTRLNNSIYNDYYIEKTKTGNRIFINAFPDEPSPISIPEDIAKGLPERMKKVD